MESTINSKSEVKSWLKAALTEENLQNFEVSFTGTSEKGDGFVGDVVFVDVIGTNNKGKNKQYNLVLKCSKSNEALTKKTPVTQETFVREIYMYENVFPHFRKFELERGSKEPFGSVAKYYGRFSSESKNVMVFENLKKIGYDLWDNKKPLTRKHIDLVVNEYAKFHAVSVAMKEHEPEHFETLTKGIAYDVIREFLKVGEFVPVFEDTVEELYNLLKNDLDEHTLEKWLGFKKQIRFLCYEMSPTDEDLQVIVHGDCWNNNFMYKYQDLKVSNVAILDWQVSKLFSPVLDLSYFVFCGIAGEEVSDLNSILKNYYTSLYDYSKRLGSTLIEHYTFEKFSYEWKKYGSYGIMMATLAVKVAYTKKENLPDIAKSAEKDESIGDSFRFGINDKTSYINRIKSIVEYAVKFELIQ